MKPSKILFSIMVAGISLAATSASAVGTRYSGTSCTVLSGAASVYYGARYNYDTTAGASVSCPIDRDDMLGIASAEARVVDPKNDGIPVTCALRVLTQTATGGLALASQSRSTPTYGGIWQTLTFGAMASAVGTHAVMHCDLPPANADASKLANYLITQ